MSDAQFVSALLTAARDAKQFAATQEEAKHKLFVYDGEQYPRDGCAITLSVLLQKAGLKVADTYMAKTLGNVLRDRNWQIIEVGQQREGDVGSTCGLRLAKNDHIYLVLEATNADEMLIADNQKPQPHPRSARGHDGKTPTKFFLRAT